MNTNLFIAKRLSKNQNKNKGFSRPITQLVIGSIALGLVVMILSLSIVSGFKNEISNKLFGFGSHIQIINYDSNFSYETVPILKESVNVNNIKSIKGVVNVQQFATKAGIIKANEQVQGVVLKGVGQDYDWSFFNEALISGNTPTYNDSENSDEIVISRYVATLLEVDINDKLVLYFIEQPPRMRRFTIKAIYETHLEEFDKMFALCDIKHIQRLNNWDSRLISGFEVSINNVNNINNLAELVADETSSFLGADGSRLKVQTIMDKYPYIFDWMGLFNTNLWVILILITLVTAVNMISGLLIIILERTQMIGILKALGYSNISIRFIFLYHAFYLIRTGLIIGNIIGISLVLIQQHFKLFKLDKDSYYIEYIPVNLDILNVVLLNVATMAIILVLLIIPSLVVSKISTIKAIKFN